VQLEENNVDLLTRSRAERKCRREKKVTGTQCRWKITYDSFTKITNHNFEEILVLLLCMIAAVIFGLLL
jgi:hypothetical protein